MSKILTLFCCLCLVSTLWAQERIQTNNESSIEELVINDFIKGSCRNVSNIITIGDKNRSIGQFDTGQRSIRMEEGIILSTGDIAIATGPNSSREAGFSFSREDEDPDLDRLATSNLFDVTGIEFDFVPQGERVSFRYVFASEEYCEFVGTSFNDVFGFFVSGPGINGTFENEGFNVAKILGTDDDVSINTVNHIDNPNFFVSNVTSGDAGVCPGINFNSELLEFIEYDGFTIVLTASFAVIPCETYHIRLLIGDVGDPILDSAVFLESNSFDLGEPVSIRAEVPGRDDAIAHERCRDPQFVFSRNSSVNFNEDLTVDFSISSDSEAINGEDFTEIPMSITIPAGDSIFILPINIIDDNIEEGLESLALEITYNCDCLNPVLSEMIINDPVDLSANFDDIFVCENQAFTLTPIIEGGLPPLKFMWETGEQTESIEVNLSEPRTYSVTITDFCNNSTVAIADINVQNIPSATLMGVFDFCDTELAGIPIQLEGNPPWRIAYSIDGIDQVPIENIQSADFTLDTPSVGAYVITSFSDANCVGRIVGTAIVESAFEVSTNISPPTCFNSADGSITINQLDGVAPFTISWSVPTEDDFVVDSLTAGLYILSILDGDGCLYQESFDLTARSNDIEECVPIYIPNGFSPNGDGINDLFSLFAGTANGILEIASFQVYNRWGTLMYEQTNFIPDNGQSGWDGNYRSQPLNSGVFVYQVAILFEDGSTQILSGDITLTR